MERFEHLAMVAFLILGLALVRLMINLTSLLAKNTIHNKNEDGVKFLLGAFSILLHHLFHNSSILVDLLSAKQFRLFPR